MIQVITSLQLDWGSKIGIVRTRLTKEDEVIVRSLIVVEITTMDMMGVVTLVSCGFDTMTKI